MNRKKDKKERTFVIWDATYCRFVESIGSSGITYTDLIGLAFQYSDRREALRVSELMGDVVVLEWL